MSCSPTIATLGTPQDVTLQELHIESFFPIDADTARGLASGKTEAGACPPKPASSGQPQMSNYDRCTSRRRRTAAAGVPSGFGSSSLPG